MVSSGICDQNMARRCWDNISRSYFNRDKLFQEESFIMGRDNHPVPACLFRSGSVGSLCGYGGCFLAGSTMVFISPHYGGSESH